MQEYHNKTFGPDFTYADFGAYYKVGREGRCSTCSSFTLTSLWQAELFNATAWAEVG